MEFEEPRGCRIVGMKLTADTTEAYDAACEMLNLMRLGEISNTDADGAYSYPFANGRIGKDLDVSLEGPRKRFKLVASDA